MPVSSCILFRMWSGVWPGSLMYCARVRWALPASHSTLAITTELGMVLFMRSGRRASTISTMSSSFSKITSKGLNTGGLGISQKPILVVMP